VNEAPPVETAAGPAAPPRPVATWRRAYQLIRAYPEATMLPLLVTQLPLAFLNAGAYFFLFYKAFPDAEYDQFNFVKDAPPGLIFGLLLTNAIYSLFSLVGVAATIVSVKAALSGRPLSLSQSLDPAFTRMGGLLALGVVFNVLAGVTILGVVIAIYFVIRFGLALHAYILEGRSAARSLGGSWTLLRGRMLRFSGLLLTLIPVLVGLLFVASIILTLLMLPFGVEDPSRTLGLALNCVAFLVLGILLIPFGAYVSSATTIFYLSAKEQSRA
jgi:hypothetical protein